MQRLSMLLFTTAVMLAAAVVVVACEVAPIRGSK
jgi:hypothetical protein